MIYAVVAEGNSTVNNADALYRRHSHFAENLEKLGAVIREI